MSRHDNDRDVAKGQFWATVAITDAVFAVGFRDEWWLTAVHLGIVCWAILELHALAKRKADDR